MLAMKSRESKVDQGFEMGRGVEWDPLIHNTRSFLAKIEPFRRLLKEDLENVLSLAQETSHSKGEHIYSEGEEVSNIWILRKGRIEIMKYTSDGKPRAIETIFPGQIFGTVYSRLEDNRTYPNTAVAYVDAIVLEIPFSTFVYLSHRSLPFVSGLCALYSQRIGEMQNATTLSHEPVAKRVARTLADLSRKVGKTLSMTKREIAELAGTSVETSIRTLGVFEKKRWISSSRGEIRLIDLSKIKSYAA